MTLTSKHLGALILAAGATLAAGCHGSATNVVGPGGTKCAISLQPSAPSIDAAGGQGTITVTAAAECVWRASTNASWIALTSDASGQGAGVIHFTASGNPASSIRKAAVIVAESRVELSQAGAPCQFALTPASETFGPEPGEGTVTIAAAIGCQWSATSGAPWLSIVGSPAGAGAGTVRYQVEANNGGTRDGALTIAGQTFVINQGGTTTACTVAIDAPGRSVPAGGADDLIAVTAPGPCPWTATSHAPWITITGGASGRGAGTVRLRIAPNSGAARVGLVTVTGRTYVVTQAAGGAVGGGTGGDDSGGGGTGGGGTGGGGTGGGGTGGGGTGGGGSCTFSIGANEQFVSSAGGQATIAVTAGSGCNWTAESNAAWISVTGGATGSGTGTVQLIIARNTGAQRVGTVTVAGRTHTITQASGVLPCSYALTTAAYSSGASGGATSVGVTTTDACQWTAKSHVSWITISNGGGGSGNGVVQLSIAANSGAQRVGTVTIAGQTFTVTQAAVSQPCTYALSPATQTVPLLGGEFTVNVTTQSGCPWTATTGNAWITFTSAPDGVGSGSVRYRIPAVSLGLLFSREGSITIGDQTLTVQQKGLLGNGS